MIQHKVHMLYQSENLNRSDAVILVLLSAPGLSNTVKNGGEDGGESGIPTFLKGDYKWVKLIHDAISHNCT